MMQRRDLLRAVALGAGSAACGGAPLGAQEHFPVPVDESLWKGINRLQNPEEETVLERLHVPVITAPQEVKAGEIFAVGVVIGRVLHPMGPTHWIEYAQLSIGNEPGGTLVFRSHGYLKPKTQFAVLLGDDLKGKTASLVVTLKCNLHGIWQHYANVQVA
jgi:superoxide reductase